MVADVSPAKEAEENAIPMNTATASINGLMVGSPFVQWLMNRGASRQTAVMAHLSLQLLERSVLGDHTWVKVAKDPVLSLVWEAQ